MEGYRQPFFHGMNMLYVVNMVTVAYFFAANGMYTLLMIRSLVAAWLRNRRAAYPGLEEISPSTATPPATIIVPAWNEEDVIVQTVGSALRNEYPGLEVVVVDDGSSDATLGRLIKHFRLVKMDFIYRSRLATRPLRGFYLNPDIPNLLVISKENGGKPDALNAGINVCRTPYFCTLDADCILERDALRRLMRPVVRSASHTAVSAGVLRVLNGCEVKDGHVTQVRLPRTRLERFQVVEYLRCFLFGRTGWNLLGGTLIVSGAFALFHRDTVIAAGGFSKATVSEDMNLIMHLKRWAVRNRRRIQMSFTMDTVCWTECPSSVRMLARQRRRWQMGLCQTLWVNAEMLFNPRYGVAGVVSFPFYLWIEGAGAAVELLGYLMVPLGLFVGMVPASLYLLLVFVSLAYAGFLSAGAVLLEELTNRRYPGFRDLRTLILFAFLENIGYRQLVLCFRFQGVVQFLTGFRKWEKITHVGAV